MANVNQKKSKIFLFLAIITASNFLNCTILKAETKTPPDDKKQQVIQKNVEAENTKSDEIKKEDDFTFIDELYQLSGEDSCETFNRAMFSTNVFLVDNVMYPAMYGYSSVMPKYGMERLRNFFQNILFVRRFMANCLQAKFSGAGVETLRFLTNTTIGIAGFYDPAKHWFDLDAHDEDFGQVFTTWGFGHGSYLHLPVYGPTNVRDGIGVIFDAAFDPRTYLFFGIGSGAVALKN